MVYGPTGYFPGQRSREQVQKEKRRVRAVLLVFFLVVLVGAIALMSSDNNPDLYHGRSTISDNKVLTDEEFNNKPYTELSDEEKKQANDRIADTLEASGVHVEGRNRDR